MKKLNKEEIIKQMKVLRNKLSKIEEAEFKEESKGLVGKCFKARNNYSMPEKPSDYWWIYLKVKKAEGRWLDCLSFERDSDSKLRLDPDYSISLGRLDGYKEISEKEFNAAFAKFKKYVEAE